MRLFVKLLLIPDLGSGLDDNHVLAVRLPDPDARPRGHGPKDLLPLRGRVPAGLRALHVGDRALPDPGHHQGCHPRRLVDSAGVGRAQSEDQGVGRNRECLKYNCLFKD